MYLDLARELKKTMEYEVDGYTNCNWGARSNPQSFGKGTRRLRNRGRSRDHPSDSMIEVGQNTEKSPGDLRKLNVTQTSVKDPQLVWNLLRSDNNNNNDNAVPADHRIKLKENEKKDKYLDLARELKNCGPWKWQLY